MPPTDHVLAVAWCDSIEFQLAILVFCFDNGELTTTLDFKATNVSLLEPCDRNRFVSGVDFISNSIKFYALFVAIVAEMLSPLPHIVFIVDSEDNCALGNNLWEPDSFWHTDCLETLGIVTTVMADAIIVLASSERLFLAI